MLGCVLSLTILLHLAKSLMSCRVHVTRQARFCPVEYASISSDLFTMASMASGSSMKTWADHVLQDLCQEGFCAVVTSIACSMRAILCTSSCFVRWVLQSFQTCIRQPAWTCELKRALLWLMKQLESFERSKIHATSKG